MPHAQHLSANLSHTTIYLLYAKRYEIVNLCFIVTIILRDVFVMYEENRKDGQRYWILPLRYLGYLVGIGITKFVPFFSDIF